MKEEFVALNPLQDKSRMEECMFSSEVETLARAPVFPGGVLGFRI